MLANSDRINSGLLDVLEKAENVRLANAVNHEDTLYEIALERLDVGKYLVAASRYAEAKTYLRDSYSKLDLGDSSVSAPTREIFMTDATLLADRIAFAEESLHGSAGALDENAFMSYLSVQERDTTLEQRFNVFLEDSKAPEVKNEPPKADEIVQRFAASRITVLASDVQERTDFPFEFDVKNARLVDRAVDGSSVTFDATYESNVSAIFNIVFNGKPMNGNFSLDDFVRIAISGETAPTVAAGSEGQSADTQAFQGLQSSEESQRSQVTAQDLAIQLMMSELRLSGILIGSTTQVDVLNATTLTQFHVAGAKIQDSAGKRTESVDFDYDTVTKELSNITLEDLFAELPAKVPADQFAKVIFDVIYGQEEQAKAMQSAVGDLDSMGYLLDAKNAKFADAALNQVEFQSLRLKLMPVEISGVYDRQGKVFIKAQNDLLTLENVSPKDYGVQVATRYVIDSLGKHGITITEANISGGLPAEKIQIENYTRGDKVIDFTYDIVGNRLTDISLKGSLSSVQSMTFEEFGLIGGGESATPVVPAAPAAPAETAPTGDSASPSIPPLPSVEIFVPPASGSAPSVSP
jgi:hypothetical protein